MQQRGVWTGTGKDRYMTGREVFLLCKVWTDAAAEREGIHMNGPSLEDARIRIYERTQEQGDNPI